jgi:O-antigen/teichoic acid export membrane protein
MSEKRRIVVNTLANGVAQSAAMLSALVLMPFLIRGLGTANYGLYLLATSISSYAVLLDLGVGASVIKMTADSSAHGDRERTGRVVSTAFAFYLLVGIVAAAILATLAFNAGTLFKGTAEDARLLRSLFMVAAVWQLWIWPATTASAVLMGRQLYKRTAVTGLLTVAMNIAVTIAVLATHQGPLMLMVGTTAASFLASIVQIVFAKRALGDVPLSPRLVDTASFRSIFSFAWAVFAIQVCSIIVYQATDRLVLGIFVGATAVALYEAAGKFQGLVSQLATFTVSAVMPMASHLGAQGRDETLRQLFLRGTKYSLMLLNPVVVVLMIVARPLLLTWLGPAFAAQAIAAQLLISHQVLTSGTAVGDSMIVGLGQLAKRVPYAVGAALLNLTISVVLVQRIGILGVVLGTMIPYLIDYPFHMRLILRGLDVPVGRWLKETVLPTYPLLLLPAVVSWALLTTSLQESFWGIAVIGVVSVGCYWIAVYGLAFQPNERADVRAALAAGLTRLRGRQA